MPTPMSCKKENNPAFDALKSLRHRDHLFLPLWLTVGETASTLRVSETELVSLLTRHEPDLPRRLADEIYPDEVDLRINPLTVLSLAAILGKFDLARDLCTQMEQLHSLPTQLPKIHLPESSLGIQ